jgi:competence protein ComEA
VPADDDPKSGAAPRPARDPLDLLIDDRPGWRARLDELTGGLPILPPWTLHAPRRRAVVAGSIVVAALLVLALAVVPRVRGSSRGSQPSIDLPRAATGSAPTMSSTPSLREPTGTVASGMWIAAAGAVNRPGLYRLRTGARVSELLVAAGGLSVDADIDRLNLAAILLDGQRLYVPRRGEASVPSVVTGDGGSPPTAPAPPSGGSSDPDPPSREHPVNLNTATLADLDRLPGVGPSTAAAIIDHRTKNGPFHGVDDLALVRGIGPAKLEQLRELVTV